jgi:hypothetical protein
LRIFLGASQQPILEAHDDHYSSGMLGVRDYCSDGDQSLSSFSNLVAYEISKAD